MLALAAHLTGWLIALRDPKHVSIESAQAMVAKNIQIGNNAAVKHINSKLTGAANENKTH
jgi:hypothetical protein